MKFEIKNRFRGEIIFSVETESWKMALELAVKGKANLGGANLRSADLGGADLGGANLGGANLYGANLGGANLYGANLRSADLYGANLRSANLGGADLGGANLRGADLYGANLGGANLRSADLGGADLGGADLRGANLGGANLYGANLRSANLGGADLRPIIESMGIEQDPTLPARILEQVEKHPETWDQSSWHSDCGTKHCIAGFATHLSGAFGKFLDKQFGTATAATLLLWREGAELPSFESGATNEETIERLRKMVAA